MDHVIVDRRERKLLIEVTVADDQVRRHILFLHRSLSNAKLVFLNMEQLLRARAETHIDKIASHYKG